MSNFTVNGNSREHALAARALKRAEAKTEKIRKAEMHKEEVSSNLGLSCISGDNVSILKGNIHFKNGRYEEAVESYKTALDIHGAKVVYMSNLAAAYLKLEMQVNSALKLNMGRIDNFPCQL